MDELLKWFEARRGKRMTCTRVDADDVPFPRNESVEFTLKDTEPKHWGQHGIEGLSVLTRGVINCYSAGDAVEVDGDNCSVTLTTGSGRRFRDTYAVIG